MSDLIKVKYLGKFDIVTAEYNGKKYAFRRDDRISVIPVEVYNYIQRSNQIFAAEIIAYTEPLPPADTDLDLDDTGDEDDAADENPPADDAAPKTPKPKSTKPKAKKPKK